MWKKLDNQRYSTIRNHFQYTYVLEYYIYAAFAAFMLIIHNIANFSDRDKAVFWIFNIIFLALLVIFGVLGTVSKIRYDSKKYLLEQNNAEYCEATVIRKKHNKDSIGFYAVVSVNGKRKKVLTTKEVFVTCDVGDTVDLVDMIGNQAKLPRSCIAVTVFQNDIDVNSENDRILGELTGKVPENEEPFYPVTDSERQYILHCERKKLTVRLIPFAICFLLSMAAALLIFLFDSKYDHSQNIALTPFLQNFLISSVFIGVLTWLIIKKDVKLLSTLKSNQLMCQKFIFHSEQYIFRGSGRQKYRHYYFHCFSPRTNKAVTLEGDFPCCAKSGEKVYAVRYDSANIRLYPLKEPLDKG